MSDEKIYIPWKLGTKRSAKRWGISDGTNTVVTDLTSRQAQRRAAGLNRGEMDLDGKTIITNPDARKRRIARKKKQKRNG